MRTIRNLGILGIGSCLGLLGCGSSHGGGGANNNDPGYHVGSGGSGNGPFAQDSATGFLPITESQATSVTTQTPGSSNACAGWSAEPEGGTPPVFEFLIDASGSMHDDPANPADPNGPNKWTVMAQTMPSVYASLPANFAVGVSYYNKPGSSYTGAQAVPIAPLGAAGSTQRNQIDQSLSNTTPNGYTPTYNAWEFALSRLTAWQAPTGYATSPKYIVVITDGVPTVLRDGRTNQNPINQAEYDWQISAIKTDGDAAGVKTFVVGVVGSENPQGATYDPLYMLSKLAIAGGTGKQNCTPVSGTPSGNTVNPRGTYCHFDLSQATDFAAALSTALGNIAQSVISCNYTVPASSNGQSVDPAKTVLVFSDGAGNYSLILQNTSSTCDKGWHFTDSTNSHIEICGSTCDTIQQTAAATLKLVFGCAVGNIVN